MLLHLGGRTYDLTHRALVIGSDILEATSAADVATLVADRPDTPVGIATDRLDVLRAAYEAGAVFGTCWDRAALDVTAAAGATALVTDPALAAGLPGALRADRVAVVVTANPPVAATAALAVIGGARVLRTTDVRAARRVCDVLAAILGATP